jgi:hypothetical protein
MVVALLDELEERYATLPARNGSRAVAGLAVQILAPAEKAACGLSRRTSQGH